jgi:nitrate/nitrite transport system permease protein
MSESRRQRVLAKVGRALDVVGLTWFVPFVQMARGEDRGYQLRRFLRSAGLPLAAILLALGAWQLAADHLTIGGMAVPTPGMVVARAGEMVRDFGEQRRARSDYDRRFAEALRDNPEMSESELREAMPFDRKRTFVDQVALSLRTVFAGVGLAVLIGVPLGILCGLSAWAYEMANPLVQLFKPVSPLAWFPLIYIAVNKAMTNPPSGAWLTKPFIISSIVVALCAVWPTVLNTANGVANVDRDYLNVAKVLNLTWMQKVRRIVLPAALPQIFTGARLSLGIGWMVLIAAEMMAVSPGIGGFIWDWYQSSNDVALSYLALAVLVIGAIGFVLDRLMIGAQKFISHGNVAAIR